MKKFDKYSLQLYRSLNIKSSVGFTPRNKKESKLYQTDL